MAKEFGRGIFLDSSLDFDVSNTGDIRATQDGTRELEKDLAFQLLIVIGRVQGQPLTPEAKAEIRANSVAVVLSDSRVKDVDRGSIRVEEVGRDTVRIQMPVFTVDGEQELVFEL